MRAMILAAGRGERLRPLTDTLPKPLVPVAGKPLIAYHLQHLAALGIHEVVINCAWLAPLLMDTLGDGRRYGVTIHYSVEAQALETGGGIKRALPLLGSEPFLVINGDIYVDKLPSLPMLKDNCLAHLWMVANPSHHPQGDFVLKDNFLVAEEEGTKLTFSGMGIYHPQLFADVNETRFALGPLLRQKIADGFVSAEQWPAYWCDVGTVARLQALEQRLTGATAL
ncbi:N-acetylmuramate alpha-1-phosphate uridylyltransferase MurU [Shewanella dokdonensis]|uniref:N-acetylmuramate alpha-1-phosphate uridylyltransferase MurU n=1 Tax=Shewanella dokdonensis TaxID=712036 RepID=UPI00200DD7BE|nr:nucleotidyltransferase family protein [Shewanella dokdonensis]MCL1074237.1 nucleotidyltransferase family protein [Shewanella dokdonensis]